MKIVNLCFLYLMGAMLFQGCRDETPLLNKSNKSETRVLPDVLDLMEYHDGRIVAEGSLNSQFSSEYGSLSYGDLEVEFSPKNRKAEDNAYSLILTIGRDRIEVVLPNASHRDFRDLFPKEKEKVSPESEDSNTERLK